MRLRRTVLVLGLSLVVGSAATRSDARSHTELESAVYGGQSTGGWLCGPAASVRYGGAAAGVSKAERPTTSAQGTGLYGMVEAAAEAQINDVARLGPDVTSGQLPPDRMLAGGHLRGGYGGRYARLEGGLGAFQGWTSQTSDEPDVTPYPELEVAVGRLRTFEILCGFGAPLITTLLRPGAYLGTGFRLEPLELVVRGGMFRRGPAILGSVGPRVDVAAIAAPPGFEQQLKLRVGLAAGSGAADRIDAEASFGAIVMY